jgi:hypothetical protein
MGRIRGVVCFLALAGAATSARAARTPFPDWRGPGAYVVARDPLPALGVERWSSSSFSSSSFDSGWSSSGMSFGGSDSSGMGY